MKTKISIFLLLILLFSSCENGINHSGSEQNNSSSHTSEKSLVVVSGRLKIDKNTVHEKSTARNAIPSVPYVYSTDDDYEYFVQAISSNGLTHEVIADPENFNYYEISLEWGERWSISAGMRKKADNSIIMLDADSASGKALSFMFDNDNLYYSFNFILQPLQKAGKGRVELSMQPVPVDSVTGEAYVTELKLYITKDGSLQEWFPDLIQVSIDSSNEDNNYIKSIGTDYNIPSGSYDVTFIYYKTYTSQSPAIKLPVYITHQVINVYDNLETTVWNSFSNNYEYDIITSSGIFRLTEKLIKQFASTTFYVGNTGVGDAPSDTSGSGSPYAPLKTLKKAAEIIQTINDESSQYRIYICEDQNLSGLTESLSLVPNDKAINLTIQGFDPQNSERQFILSGYNESSQKSQFNGAFIKIAGKSNSDTIVTLRNLSIYGHKNTLSSASNGGGLLCSQAKVLLENVDIRDNECGEKGAGIFATSSSIVTIKDSYIEGNIVTDLDKAFGAGIALMAGATVYIEGNTHILENESAKDGGGIGVSDTGSNKLYINDGHIYGNTAVNGGGVYNGKELYFSAGGISQNIATALGGGVYSSGSMFMYGSAVIGDSAKTTAATDLVHSNKAGAKGGGIYSTGNLYLGYSSWTSESSNTPQELTGGIFYNFSPDVGGIFQYADNNSYLFKMKSGSVSYNAGRGIYVGKCKFSMTGGTVKGNTAISGTDENTEYQLNGAGLYAGTGATITVSGGTITENHAEENGGGLYTAQNDSIIILEDGTISSNTADGNGNGIAVTNGYLKMKGAANVDSTNNIYLESGKYIEITDALSGTAPVAKVTLADFSRGKTIVQAAGNVTVLTPYKDYFAFTQEGWESKLSADKTSIIIDAPIYVAGQNLHPYCGVAGNDTNGKGTKAEPFATIAKAATLMNSSVDYTIYIDGTLTGVQSISDSSIQANSITIQGTSSSATINGNKGGPALQLTEAINNITILKLNITNGKTSANGGGIVIPDDSNGVITKVTLGDGTADNGVAIYENTAVNGGGIYIGSGNELTITNGCKIYNNTAIDEHSPIKIPSGGGICSKSTINMSGGEIYGNKIDWDDSIMANGGGVYINGDESVAFNFSGGRIYGNKARYGGGIYNGVKIFMSGSAVVGNKAKKSLVTETDIENGANYAFGGGGINNTKDLYIGYTSESQKDTDFSGGIFFNYAKSVGGGVYNSGPTNNYLSIVKIAGGSIACNRAGSRGGAVYQGAYSSCFEMGDYAYIPQDNACTNDIYLSSDKFITVNSRLWNSDYAWGYRKTVITHASPDSDTKVLDGSRVSSSYDEYKYFSINSDSFYISSDGLLHAPETKAVSTLLELQEAVDTLSEGSGCEIDLLADITVSADWDNPVLRIPANATVILKSSTSKKITCRTSTTSNSVTPRLIELDKGAKLVLDGITLEGSSESTKFVRAVHADSGGEIIMKGSTVIKDFYYENGSDDGLFYLCNGAIFTMQGGTISNCRASGGGSVAYLWKGIFNFYGGKINGCRSPVKIDAAGGVVNWKKNATDYDDYISSSLENNTKVNIISE